jgi:hypothetical protein
MTPLAVAAPRCESPCRHHAALVDLTLLLVLPLAIIILLCCPLLTLAVLPLAIVVNVLWCRPWLLSLSSCPPTPIARLRPGRVDRHMQPHVVAADGIVGMRIIVVAIATTL